MKKFLSLVLALVMTMSLVTVGAGAKDFTDAEDINYDAAVEVMSAIGVVDGDVAGNFNPQNGLTRGAAAKIICNLILGPTTAAELNADTDPFVDVDQDSTFAGYIAYCAKEGIVGGYADGTFKPAAPLTGYAFMKMLLGALGYDADVEGYTGANWSINVAKQAIGIGLNAGLKTDFNGSDFVTREEAMLYAFNTLQATMVEYDAKTSVSVGDAAVVIAGSEAEYVAQAGYKDTMNAVNLQFAEKYFSKLSVKPATDDFMRPANTWINNKTEIGTYVDYTLLVDSYTVAVDGKDLNALLGSTAIKESAVEYYVDGKVDATIKNSNMIKTNTQDYATTGKGVLTEVYYDKDAEVITIVSVNTFLAQAMADYNEKKETLSLTVFNGYNDDVVALDDVAGIVEYKEDDMVLVNMAWNGTDYDVVAVFDPEVANDVTLSKYSVGSYVVAADEQIDYAKKITLLDTLLADYSKTALTNYTYNTYVDQYGYLIGIEVYEGEANYLFLTGYDLSGSNLANKTATANAIFLDGTMATIEVNVTETNKKLVADTQDAAYAELNITGDYDYNKWFTYTVKNDVYTLTPVAAAEWLDVEKTAADDKNINCASARIVGDGKVAYGNDDSIYLTVDTDVVMPSTAQKGISEVTGTYTGIQNVDLKVVEAADAVFADSIYVVFDADRYIIGAVVVGEDASSTENYAYAVKSAQNEYVDADDNYYWDFKAIVDGAYVTLTVKDEYNSLLDTAALIQAQLDLTDRALFKLTYDKDGYVVDAELVDDETNNYDNREFVNQTAITDDYKSYDVSFVGDDQVLKAIGRTLYVEGYTSLDVGLTVAADAPIVVVQKDTLGNLLVEEYNTLAQALNALEDSYAATAAKEFDGIVTAMLNENGTAKYLVLKSTALVPVTTDDGSSPAPSTDISSISAGKETGTGLLWVKLENATAGTDYTVEVTMYTNGVAVDMGGYTSTANAGGYIVLPISVATGANYTITHHTGDNLLYASYVG